MQRRRFAAQVLAHVGQVASTGVPELEPEAPLYDPAELLGMIPEESLRESRDAWSVVACWMRVASFVV